MKNNLTKKVLAILFSVVLLTVIVVFLGTTLGNENRIPEPVEEVKGDNTEICTILESQIQKEFSTLAIPRKWYLRSPYVKEDEINLEIPISDSGLQITYHIDEKIYTAQSNSTGWNIQLPISKMTNGEKQLTIYADFCDKQIFKQFSFNVSEPVYVTWTIDWEGFDVKEEYLKEMSAVSKQYSVPMTHFFNPYIYIYLPKSRSTYLTNWVLSRNSKYSESIGLHLHMYTNLVQAAGVTPNNTVTWGSPTGNGHDTPNSMYGYKDYKKIISWALTRFNEHGLNTPTMYRAGGWYIDEENIQVLNDMNFLIESSGRTYYKHGRNILEGHWNLKNTTQPYQLNKENQNITNTPNLTIWEFPNNGGDSWTYDSEQLTARFLSNYKGGVSKEKKVVTFLSHPHWFDKEGVNIKGVFEEIKEYNYSTDSGPVIYLTLDKVYEDIVQL